MKTKTVGILYICTGNYNIFWKDFYISMEKYFLPDIEKKYFVFTDSTEIDFEVENKNIYRFYQEDLGWPYNTLNRFHMFLDQEDKIKDTEYLFFFNANLLVQEVVNDYEFLPKGNEKLLAVIHPSYFDKKRKYFPYDCYKKSTAFIPSDKGVVYVQGALQGGVTENFISALKKMKENIDIDYKNKIIAKWHDESHWNCYIIDRNDVKILSPGYVYPEGWNIPFDLKILSRDKNKYGGHLFLRKEKEKFFTKIKNKIKRFFIKNYETTYN